jgi:hypothetical protein
MRVHYVLNHGGTPESKLADVEIHFEEGLLSGLKLDTLLTLLLLKVFYAPAEANGHPTDME